MNHAIFLIHELNFEDFLISTHDAHVHGIGIIMSLGASALDALLRAVQSAATMRRYHCGGHEKRKRRERAPHERSERRVSSLLPPAAFAAA